MLSRTSQPGTSLYVDRNLPSYWIVRDRDGAFWMVSPGEAWEHRQPYVPSESTRLEPVPSHYKYLLGLTE